MECSATYLTVKSSRSRATIRIKLASVTSANTAQVARRAASVTRASGLTPPATARHSPARVKPSAANKDSCPRAPSGLAVNEIRFSI